MDETFRIRFFESESGNLKSKIENLKLVGIVTLVLVFAVWAVRAEAQQPKKVQRIGYLSGDDRASDSARAEAIRLALRERGYVEGQNLVIEYRYAEGRRNRLPELAAELVRLNLDVIVAAGGGSVIRVARNATQTIPIVMTGSGADPVKAGFVESLARPGGNVTGVTNVSYIVGGKRLELLKEVVAKLARVAFLYDAANSDALRELREDLPDTARALKLKIEPWDAKAADDFEKIFAAMGAQRPGGIYVAAGGPLMRPNRKRIVGFALKNRLPSVYNSKEFVEAGGLMSYSADLGDSYKRVAYYVDRILRGTKPEDLPVEQPMKFELVVNFRTAKQIGVTIPQSVLYRANRVIQ
jgi:putative ABC transport system substrate-binding protein